MVVFFGGLGAELTILIDFVKTLLYSFYRLIAGLPA
jgi:hypothetical protein